MKEDLETQWYAADIRAEAIAHYENRNTYASLLDAGANIVPFPRTIISGPDAGSNADFSRLERGAEHEAEIFYNDIYGPNKDYVA